MTVVFHLIYNFTIICITYLKTKRLDILLNPYPTPKTSLKKREIRNSIAGDCWKPWCGRTLQPFDRAFGKALPQYPDIEDE